MGRRGCSSPSCTSAPSTTRCGAGLSVHLFLSGLVGLPLFSSFLLVVVVAVVALLLVLLLLLLLLLVQRCHSI